MKEFFSLFWTRLVVQLKNFKEGVKVAFRYWPNFAFFKQDRALLRQYFFISPFTISKRFLQKKGVIDVYTYGETPLTTLDEIAKQCHITKDDYVIELGCGRGRSCFWLHHFVGCRVKGIDYIPEFIEKANKVNRSEGVAFECADFLKASFEGATVIYLYGTCLEDELICKLIERFKELPEGTKIITVSYPLSDYTEDFEVIDQFSARFTWGVTDVYIQNIIKLS